MILNSLPRSAGVFMETRTSVRRLMVSISPPVVTQTISANGCVIAPATRLILSLLISPDGVIIPLSSRVFFIGFSFSSMVPVVPKWCPDVKNRVVKRKTATITRYKKSLCLQGFSQITYKKICGNTGRFWLFHDPRNAVYVMYLGFESLTLRHKSTVILIELRWTFSMPGNRKSVLRQ